MSITYNTRKDLPSEQLHKLFMSVSWSDGTETSFMLKNFNMPFINSNIVISAWENDYLVGCVRVLSDKIVRSVILDLAVTPEFQNQGIGKELIRRPTIMSSHTIIADTHTLANSAIGTPILVINKEVINLAE